MIEYTTVELVDIVGDPGRFTIGGKAAGLARLASAGLPVPPARVIPAEAGDADIARLAADLASLWPGATLAVRSSAVGEDSIEASFAGQFESVLDVPAECDAIVAAVQRVRASADADRVVAYGHGTHHPMAVLVMPMVDADAAGIAFTRDPVSGANTVIVEAVRGVADRLASGEATGERWVVDDALRCDKSLGVLSTGQAASIADLARRVEQCEDTAVDIEWAIADGEALLLQARPITALVEPIPMDDEIPAGFWQWDSTHNRAPVSPLLADVFPEGMRRGSTLLRTEYGAPLDHLAIRALNGYFYISVVPIGGKQRPLPPAPVMRLMFRIVPPLRRVAKTARRALAEDRPARRHQRWLTERRVQVERTLDEWHDLDLAALGDTDLAALIHEAVELARDVFSWNMSTDPAYLLPLADLHRFVERELGEGIETVTRLLAGSARSAYRDSVEALCARLTPDARAAITGPDPLRRLAEIDPETEAAYRIHQRRHGTRVLGFDLTYPTQLEQEEAELARIAAGTVERDPSGPALELAAELASRLDPRDAGEFDRLLDAARSTYWIREEGEAVHASVLGQLRLIVLEAGRRLVAAGQATRPDDACFLGVDELTGWLHNATDVAESIRTRRGQHRWAAAQTPPASFGHEVPMPPPEALPPAVARILDCFRLISAHDQMPADHPDGVAASPGIHTGPVRVVEGPHQFASVRPGDVLVAPLTTSSWEVLFPHIGALVTEGGGQLSHPAIVAREYGLPAIVGCEGATTRFTTGQIVTVDGSTGVITPME